MLCERMHTIAADPAWHIPPPGCWPTELQAARLRLSLGMLLHGRLGSDAYCRVFTRDSDVLASIGMLVIGRRPLAFTRTSSPGPDAGSCNGVVYGDEGGRGTAVCSHARMHAGVHYAEFSLLSGDPRGIRLGIVQADYLPRRGHWATDSHWEADGAAAEVDAAQSAGWCFDPSAGRRPTRARGLLAPRATHSPFEGAPRHLAQTFIGEECALGDRIGIQLAFCGEHTHREYDKDVQVELTVFRNGEELGVRTRARTHTQPHTPLSAAVIALYTPNNSLHVVGAAAT